MLVEALLPQPTIKRLEVAKFEQQLGSTTELPDQAFIAEQIRQLPTALCSDERRAAQLLGKIFDTIRVYRVTPPGIERGYHELRFHLSAWRIIEAALQGQLPNGVLACINERKGNLFESSEFCLIVRPRRSQGRPPAA